MKFHFSTGMRNYMDEKRQDKTRSKTTSVVEEYVYAVDPNDIALISTPALPETLGALAHSGEAA